MGVCVTNECLRLLKKSLARAPERNRFNVKQQHNEVDWQDLLYFYETRHTKEKAAQQTKKQNLVNQNRN